jgi:hypothetical protein
MPVIARGSGYAFSTVQSVFISVWRRQATLESLKLVREHQLRLVESSPAGIAVVTVMEPVSVKPLNGVERAEAAAVARDLAPHTLASAYVFEGEGFRPAMSRAAVAGVLLLSRIKYPHKVFATVTDGARWLKTEAPDAPDPAAVLRHVEEARRQIL